MAKLAGKRKNMATRKELFQTIIEEMSDNEEVVAMCRAYIERLDKQYARKGASEETVELRAALATHMMEAGDFYFFLKDVADDMEVSWQRVNSAMQFLVKEGLVEKVPPEKKGGATLYHWVG